MSGIREWQLTCEEKKILPGETAKLVVKPSRPFAGKRFIVPNECCTGLRVLSIKIGEREILGEEVSIPARFFNEFALFDDKLNAGGGHGFEWTKEPVIVTVKNVGDVPIEVLGAWRGYMKDAPRETVVS